jgi:hypothetical protein
MDLCAWGSFDGHTAIKYVPVTDGAVELSLGGAIGLNLLVSDAGLTRLAEVLEAARQDPLRLALREGER